MRKVIFDKYLEFNCFYAMTQQLYKNHQITRSELLAAKKQIRQMEIDLIAPKQKISHHPRKLTVIE